MALDWLKTCTLHGALCGQFSLLPRDTYPGGQMQPLTHGGAGEQVKFMARFAQESSQFTPADGKPGT